MSNGRLVHYDVQAESSGRLLKSPLAGGGGGHCGSHITAQTACFIIEDFNISKISVKTQIHDDTMTKTLRTDY